MDLAGQARAMLPEKLTAEEVTAAAQRAVAGVQLPAAFTDLKLPNMDSITSKLPPLPTLPAGWELPKVRRKRERRRTRAELRCEVERLPSTSDANVRHVVRVEYPYRCAHHPVRLWRGFDVAARVGWNSAAGGSAAAQATRGHARPVQAHRPAAFGAHPPQGESAEAPSPAGTKWRARHGALVRTLNAAAARVGGCARRCRSSSCPR